jgi:hypothetical protein
LWRSDKPPSRVERVKILGWICDRSTHDVFEVNFIQLIVELLGHVVILIIADLTNRFDIQPLHQFLNQSNSFELKVAGSNLEYESM